MDNAAEPHQAQEQEGAKTQTQLWVSHGATFCFHLDSYLHDSDAV